MHTLGEREKSKQTEIYVSMTAHLESETLNGSALCAICVSGKVHVDWGCDLKSNIAMKY
jgi:hypothetical protein